MLYSQIPHRLLSRIVGELKLDLKVLSVSLRKRETDETLYSKLEVVEHYLSKELGVGTISEPGSWFRGALPMCSGVWSEHQGPDGSPSGGMLYFSGEQDGTLVALIGSAHHRIGQQSAASYIYLPHSGLPELFSVLTRDERDTSPLGDRGASILPDDNRVIREVFDFANALTGIPQPSEFLARRLLDGQVESRTGSVQRVVLGTPVYMALAEDECGAVA
jgi:hypothetical protein